MSTGLNFFGIHLFAVVVLCLPLCGLAVDTSVDFVKVNPLLQSLLDPILEGDNLVSSAFPKFDEDYSNLEEEKIKFDLTSTLKNVPWSSVDTTLLKASSRYQVDRRTLSRGISVQVESEVASDILSLVRHAGKLALNKRERGGYSHALELKGFDSSLNGLLMRLSLASTLQEVYAVLQAGEQLVKNKAREDFERTQNQLKLHLNSNFNNYGDNSSKDELIASFNKRLGDLRRLMGALESTHLILNDRLEIEYSTPYPERLLPKGPGIIKLRLASVRITPKVIEVTTKAFVPMNVERLNSLKADLKRPLLGVQNEAEAQVLRVQEFYRDALVAFKKAIREEVAAAESGIAQ